MKTIIIVKLYRNEPHFTGIQSVIEIYIFWIDEEVTFFNSWRDRRFKADGQKEAGNYEAGGEETGPPQGLGGHRGCH